MPFQPGNQFALKPEEERLGDTFSLRAPIGVKGLANLAAGWGNAKLNAFCIDAIREKIVREASPAILKAIGIDPKAFRAIKRDDKGEEIQAKLAMIRDAYEAQKQAKLETRRPS